MKVLGMMALIITTIASVQFEVSPSEASNANAGAPDLSIAATTPISLAIYGGPTTCDLKLTANGENIVASFSSGSANLRYCDGSEYFLVRKMTPAVYEGANGARIIGVNAQQILVTYRGRTELFTYRFSN